MGAAEVMIGRTFLFGSDDVRRGAGRRERKSSQLFVLSFPWGKEGTAGQNPAPTKPKMAT
jgi:hypothetical protein